LHRVPVTVAVREELAKKLKQILSKFVGLTLIFVVMDPFSLSMNGCTVQTEDENQLIRNCCNIQYRLFLRLLVELHLLTLLVQKESTFKIQFLSHIKAIVSLAYVF
jgi:hypothetical protein